MNNRFAKDIGVYTCDCCKRKTREVDADAAFTSLCMECYELGGYENMITDASHPPCEADNKYIIALLNSLQKKGVNPKTVFEYCDLVGWKGVH